MKRSDIHTGTYYMATGQNDWARGGYVSADRIEVIDAGSWHEYTGWSWSHRSAEPRMVPLADGTTIKLSAEIKPGSAVGDKNGVLCASKRRPYSPTPDADADGFITEYSVVMLNHIRCTWAEWPSIKAERDDARARTKVRRNEQKATIEGLAEQLREAGIDAEARYDSAGSRYYVRLDAEAAMQAVAKLAIAKEA